MHSLNISSRVLSPILEQIETPMSRSIRAMLGNDDYRGILRISVDPRSYQNAVDYYKDAFCASLLRKMQRPVPGVDRRHAAVQKWILGEQQCFWTNERLSPFLYGAPLGSHDRVIRDFLSRVKKKIASWIGTKPPSLNSISELGRFGPGATFSDRGRLTTVPDKMVSIPTITPSALRYLIPWAPTKWGQLVSSRQKGKIDVVRGNRFTTVPKTGLTDRAIAVEPAINIFYQLAFGKSIRTRLKASTGWDLLVAQPIHREMARKSSLDKSFCTIDLSNASDTLCINLVRLLLPPLWLEELLALRSTHTFIDGKWRLLEKFSSMGNGFTFELETLVFAAICSTLLNDLGRPGLLGKDVFVFGDDIIIPDECFSLAKSVLNFCGFVLNDEKCFHGSDKFRESCGGDFFEGADVRPFFISDDIFDPWELLPTRNGLYGGLQKLASLGHPIDFRCLDALDNQMPREIRRCVGPVELGDSVIHSPESEWRPKWKHGIRYFRARIVIPSLLRWNHWTDDVVLACALYGTGDGTPKVTPRRSSDRGGITPRNPLLSYKVGWVPFS